MQMSYFIFDNDSAKLSVLNFPWFMKCEMFGSENIGVYHRWIRSVWRSLWWTSTVVIQDEAIVCLPGIMWHDLEKAKYNS